MMEVLKAERRSAVLTPSGLACLARMPTINLTAGCIHQCRYCYTSGYSTYPGEGKVRFYTNTLEKLQSELARKREKPAAVYFSPSSDPFQPISEVLDMAYDVFKYLLQNGIGVAFVTKGQIPQKHLKLLKSNAPLIRGQIGLITCDEKIASAFEPNAPPPKIRLTQAKELLAAGVAIEARLDPILPGITDDESTFDSLCSALTDVGVQKIAASVLFLRPSVTGSLRRYITDHVMLQPLLKAFSFKQRIGIHAGKSVVSALPLENRQIIFNRLKSVAKRYKIEIKLCACKNPDIQTGTCNISGQWSKARNIERQLPLYED